MKYVGAALLCLFIIVALFGLPALLSHSGHHMGCPLQAAGEVMCENTTIDHLSLWQTMFASIVSVLVLFGGCGYVMMHSLPRLSPERFRTRIRFSVSDRPTELQMLYSRGILNRKEPYAFL